MWRIEPGAREAVAVTPWEIPVSAYTVGPDGRAAYGTWDGRVYAETGDGVPRLLYDTGEWTDYPIVILEIAWSPDGNHLLYTAHFWGFNLEEFGYQREVEQFTGLWAIDLVTNERRQLQKNHYPLKGENVTPFYALDELTWSPDGQGLLVNVGRWDGGDVGWFYPMDPELNGDWNYEFPPNWPFGTWIEGGASLLVGGMGYGPVGDLHRVDPQTGQVAPFLTGEDFEVGFTSAAETSLGLFLVAFDWNEYDKAFYHLVEDEEAVRIERVGPPEAACQEGRFDVAWYPSQGWAAGICSGSDRLFALSLSDGGYVDLSAYLPSSFLGSYIVPLWGP